MKPRILIVEDEPGIADTLQYALRTDGFEPAWAATGEDALAQMRTQARALVVMDVGLPDINGFDLFKRLLELGDVPVVFLTARSDEIDRVVGLELGADDYVPKPFSPRELVARVRSILRRTAKAPAAPPTPVSASRPPVTARPKACVSRSSSPQFAPPPHHAVRRSGSTRTRFIGRRSIINPPSTTACPATECPPPLTETSRPCSRASASAAITSATPVHRAISAGDRSIDPFQTLRCTS